MEISVRNLYKTYHNVPVLENINFTLSPGVTCLMAPSGRGKTTLLRLLLGLERPDSGILEGLYSLRLSAVFQEDRLLEFASARDNLRFVLGPLDQEDAVCTLLSDLLLDPKDSKPVSAYSGGMRRRVALARALAVPFDALFLDEPFTGLDLDTRKCAATCILRRAAGKIVLLVTHDPSDAISLGAEIIQL